MSGAKSILVLHFVYVFFFVLYTKCRPEGMLGSLISERIFGSKFNLVSYCGSSFEIVLT